MKEVVLLNRTCSHTNHSETLIGLDKETGDFKTKGAQAYPSALNRQLAEVHLLSMIKRGPLGGMQKIGEETFEASRATKKAQKGEKLPVPPIASHWDKKKRWKEAFRWSWDHPEHINVLEAKCLLAALRHKTRRSSSWGKRHLFFTDSQVTLGSLSKGRSSRPGMNWVCRVSAGLSLGFDLRLYIRWVPTKRNLADGPSRGFGIGPAPLEPRVVMPRSSALKLPENFKVITG
jgi:hypothetical protein